VHNRIELFLVGPGQVALLQDAHVALHVENGLVGGDLGAVDRRHARFLLQDVHSLLVLVAARPNSFRCPIDHIFVDRALIEALIFAPCPRFRL